MKQIIFAVFISLFLLACTSSKTASTESTGQDLSWFASSNLTDIQQQAIAVNKPIFLDISASWCGYCKKMKKNVYTSKNIGTALNAGYVSASLYGEVGDGKALFTKLNLQGFPTQVVMDAKGNVLKQNTGYLSKKELLAFIAK
jgi:thioredoxin 1